VLVDESDNSTVQVVSRLAVLPRGGHLAALAVLWALLVLYGSVVPLDYQPLNFGEAIERFPRVMKFGRARHGLADFGVNLMLFLPLGFLVLGAIDLDRKSRKAGLVATPIIILLLIAWSVGIEFSQLWFPKRTTSPFDVTAQGVGAVAGIIVWWIVGTKLIGLIRMVNAPRADTNPIRPLLVLYVIGLVFYSVQPFDIVLDLEAIRYKYYSGRIAPIPFSHGYGSFGNTLWQIGVDVLLFIPVGMLFRLGKKELRSFSHAAILVVLCVSTIEFVQIFVYSRFADATDVVVQSVGGLLGAALVGVFHLDRIRPRIVGEVTTRSNLKFAVVLAQFYVIPLGFIYFWPFEPVLSFDHFLYRLVQLIRVPFQAYYQSTGLNAFSHMMQAVVVFVPLGSLLRWGAGAKSGMKVMLLVVPGVAIGIGLVVEVVQAASVNLHVDITDVMMYTVGALVGWWMWGAFTKPLEAESAS
jgi:glycopeptide antibiotics resistance protein